MSYIRGWERPGDLSREARKGPIWEGWIWRRRARQFGRWGEVFEFEQRQKLAKLNNFRNGD
ncbi:hypothetical protein HPP92_020898 [Vanilla planifolia]|uniref:Uncharacterized protein n=1 Tax=Vanilla planifolia TaxID=51239 RepID=A0A835UIG6_VANPL|nr:hypothetical protein HPP92_020898 [Vanilla planifolia]